MHCHVKCTLTQDAGEALLKLFAGLGEGLNSLRGPKPYEELPSSAGRASAEVLVVVVVVAVGPPPPGGGVCCCGGWGTGCIF